MTKKSRQKRWLALTSAAQEHGLTRQARHFIQKAAPTNVQQENTLKQKDSPQTTHVKNANLGKQVPTLDSKQKLLAKIVNEDDTMTYKVLRLAKTV